MNKLHKDTANIVYQYVYRDTFNDVMMQLRNHTEDIVNTIEAHNKYYGMYIELKIGKCTPVQRTYELLESTRCEVWTIKWKSTNGVCRNWSMYCNKCSEERMLSC